MKKYIKKKEGRENDNSYNGLFEKPLCDTKLDGWHGTELCGVLPILDGQPV